MPLIRPLYFGGVSASLILLTDFSSKFFARNFETSSNNEWLAIRLTYNKGIAFSMFPELTLLTNLIGLSVSLYLLYCITKARSTQTALTLGLLLGGALGNLGERILFGRVTDFIAIEGFAVINLADIAIILGLALYLGHLAKASKLLK